MTENKTYIIAEVGQAHDGSIGILHSYIDAIALTGADAAKFQAHIADAESSEYEAFRIPFSYEDKTRYDYWKRMTLSKSQWIEIKKHCNDVGLEFIASPFSVKAARMLNEIGVEKYKIASGETNNLLMLDYICRTEKEIWISTGLSDYSEIAGTLNFLNHGKRKIVLFQCASRYPTAAEDIGLNVIGEYSRRFNLPVGWSDHSGDIFAPLAAVSLGVTHVESHITFDKKMFGPDSASSLTVDMFTQMVRGIRYLDKALARPVDKNDLSKIAPLRTLFGKSLCVNKDLSKGHIVRYEDLESKKPADRGIPASDFRKVTGRKLARDIAKGNFIKKDDIREK